MSTDESSIATSECGTPSARHFRLPARMTSRVVPMENSTLPSQALHRYFADNLVLGHLLAGEKNYAKHFEILRLV